MNMETNKILMMVNFRDEKDFNRAIKWLPKNSFIVFKDYTLLINRGVWGMFKNDLSQLGILKQLVETVPTNELKIKLEIAAHAVEEAQKEALDGTGTHDKLSEIQETLKNLGKKI